MTTTNQTLRQKILAALAPERMERPEAIARRINGGDDDNALYREVSRELVAMKRDGLVRGRAIVAGGVWTGMRYCAR